jgi:sugar (pentulose or hexulose) kinase
MAVILGLDIGTSKLAALAWRSDTRQVLATRSVPNDADVRLGSGSRHEQDPLRILSRAMALLRDLVADGAVPAGAVAAVGITGQMHGVVLVGPERQPATALITWRDQRTLEDEAPGSLSAARRLLPPDAARRAGCELHAGYGGATLHWLAQRDALPERSLALSIADYVAAVLSGVLSTTPDFAASWGLYDHMTGGWDADTVTRLHIPNTALPPICPAAHRLGDLLPDRAAALGLGEQVWVCAPVGDNQASVVGATEGHPAAAVNLGTGGQISVPRSEYTYVRGLETRPMPLGGCIVVGASLCGGWAYAYLCQFFRQVIEAMTDLRITEDEAYTRLNTLAADAPAGAGGLIADTHYGGARQNPDRRGSFTNIDTHNLTPQNAARAVLEGMVRELAHMAQQIGLENVVEIIASGNAVRKNPLLQDIIATQFGLQCTISKSSEEAALGAALCAAPSLEKSRRCG